MWGYYNTYGGRVYSFGSSRPAVYDHVHSQQITPNQCLEESTTDFYHHDERIYQLATALEHNKYLCYLSKNGGLLREKEGRDVIMYW